MPCSHVGQSVAGSQRSCARAMRDASDVGTVRRDSCTQLTRSSPRLTRHGRPGGAPHSGQASHNGRAQGSVVSPHPVTLIRQPCELRVRRRPEPRTQPCRRSSLPRRPMPLRRLHPMRPREHQHDRQDGQPKPDHATMMRSYPRVIRQASRNVRGIPAVASFPRILLGLDQPRCAGRSATIRQPAARNDAPDSPGCVIVIRRV